MRDGWVEHFFCGWDGMGLARIWDGNLHVWVMMVMRHIILAWRSD